MTNIRSMILNEKVNKFNDFDRKVKISFDKNQINNCFYSGSNLYSPKNFNPSNELKGKKNNPTKKRRIYMFFKLSISI